MTTSQREGERSTLPAEDVPTLATEPEAQAEPSPDEQVLTEEARRRAELYAEKLAAALRDSGDTR